MTAWLTKRSIRRTANEPKASNDTLFIRTDEEREMLLSPCFALNTTTTTELWIEQALEAYPCSGVKRTSVKATPKHREVKKLRKLQSFSFFGCLQSIFAAQPSQALQA